MSVQTISKRILSERQTDYAPEDQVIFNIQPTDVAILSGKNSYLRCNFTILKKDGAASCKASLDYAGGGAYSMLDRVQLWSGDGATLLESVEDVGMLMGTKNFYSKTRGLQNVRNLLEGLTNSDGSSFPADPNSQYYDLNTLGEADFTMVEVCLKLDMLGCFWGKVFPVIVTKGLQLRLMLNSAAKSLKATLSDGFIVQRSRQGEAPGLADLPYNANQITNGAPFTTATTPIVGNVSQQLPSCWELAASAHVGSLSLVADAALGDLTSGVTAATPGVGLGPYATTSSGSGTGATMTLTIAALPTPNTITSCTISAAGTALYDVGDTLVIASALVPGATADIVFTLTAAAFVPATAITGVQVKMAGSVAVGPYASAAAPLVTNIRSNVLASAGTCCNLVGQHLYALSDQGAVVDLTPLGITSVQLVTGQPVIEFSFASFPLGTNTFTATNHIPIFGAVLDPNIVGASATNGSCALSYKVEDIQLICESIEPAEQMVRGFMAQANSQGGFSMDIKTTNLLKQNLFKGQVVSQSLLPTTCYRAKAVMEHFTIPFENLNSSYFESVNDNLRQYQYNIKNKNIPNRKVKTDKEYAPDQNSWNVLADAERTKALAASGVQVRRETHPSARFVIGRELAKPSHSFDANTNDIRLSLDWGISRNTGGTGAGTTQLVPPQWDKLLLTRVSHFRKLTMKGDNVEVAY